MQDVKGLVGVFTGAGEGMGRAMVLNLARAGMNIAVLDINEEAARTTATDCIEVGVNAVGIRCDVTLFSDLDAAASRKGGTRRGEPPMGSCRRRPRGGRRISGSKAKFNPLDVRS